MATGRLGAFDLAATTNTTVYECPAATFAVVTLSVVNRNATSSRAVRVALSTTGSPSASEWVEYDTSLLSKGVLERTGLVLSAGQRVVVYASATDCSAVVYGIETSTA